MTKKFIVSLFLCWGMFSSCSENRIYEEFHVLSDMEWAENDSVVFDLRGLQSLEGRALIAIRYTEYYPHSNCYIRVISLDSAQRSMQNKLLNVPIFHSKTGQPMGKGFGNSYTKYDTLPFAIPEGTKLLVMKQYMRNDPLEGIEAVGLKIVKP